MIDLTTPPAQRPVAFFPAVFWDRRALRPAVDYGRRWHPEQSFDEIGKNASIPRKARDVHKSLLEEKNSQLRF
jgi:hypothetical protein